MSCPHDIVCVLMLVGTCEHDAIYLVFYDTLLYDIVYPINYVVRYSEMHAMFPDKVSTINYRSASYPNINYPHIKCQVSSISTQVHLC